ncbi:hypothetical protein KVT40_006813 [Elsinoe batatas]|uniref:Uncharacterized protein n=1 Tax=Elsinoe batatas TaxID=2601811 RepID=A0A8K0KWZ4_9PEZI|nr:hypothetical protein KVT40_006813 [Elsinoe batatas]
MAELSYLPRFLYYQWFLTPAYPTQSFEGKTIVVTGANTGLGFEAAKHFVRLGAEKVIIAVRTVSKGEEAKRQLEEATRRTGVVEVWQLDLSSYNSVQAFAAKATSELKRIDVLLENAGINTQKFARTEGNESTITTNVISTMLLALLLLPKLRETADTFSTRPHLTIVSSEVHFFSDLPERKDPSGSIFATLADESKFSATGRYPTSKLVLVMAIQRLVEEQRLKNKGASDGVIINHVNPGLCRSELARDAPGFAITLVNLIFGARTTEVGSRTLVDAASFGPESHGQYLGNSRIERHAKFLDSEEGKKTSRRVWDELKEILEGVKPGVVQNV